MVVDYNTCVRICRWRWPIFGHLKISRMVLFNLQNPFRPATVRFFKESPFGVADFVLDFFRCLTNELKIVFEFRAARWSEMGRNKYTLSNFSVKLQTVVTMKGNIFCIHFIFQDMIVMGERCFGHSTKWVILAGNLAQLNCSGWNGCVWAFEV